MECNEARDLSPCETMEPLREEYIKVGCELKKAKNQRRKLELKEELDDLRISLGWDLMDCGEFEEGLALYRQLSWTTHGEIKCNGMARALTEMKCYDQARKLLRAGSKRYPNSYMLWVAKGGFYASLGDTCESIKCFDKAIFLAPEGSWEPRYNKAITLERLCSYEEAIELLDSLIDEYPEDPKFLAERGCCANEMGYSQDAIRYYQGAMGFWKKNPSVDTGICIYAGLCFAYSELGEKRKAMEIALEGLKRFPDEDPVLYQNVGATFLDLGWKEEAREVLKEGVEKFPEDEDLKQFFKDLNEDLDDPDGGIKPPILGLILLAAILQKRFRKR